MIPIPLNAASRIGLNVLLLLAGVIALRLGESVIVPMLIALLLATVLGPAAYWLHTTLKIRWGLACIVVISGLILANGLIIAVFSSTVMRVVNQLSDQPEMLKKYKKFREKLEKNVPIDLDEVLLPKNPETINEIGVFRYVAESAPVILQQAARLTRDWTWEVVVILFTTFFVLLEGRMLARRAAAIFGPSKEVQDKVTEVLLEMAKQQKVEKVFVHCFMDGRDTPPHSGKEFREKRRLTKTGRPSDGGTGRKPLRPVAPSPWSPRPTTYANHKNRS